MPERDPWDFSDLTPQTAPPDAPGRAGSPPTPPAPTAYSFAEEPDARGSLRVARPPLTWLGIAGGLALIGGLLAAVLGGWPPAAVAGWALAGPLAIGALAWFTILDTRAAAHSTYVAPTWLRTAYGLCLVICLAGVLVGALRIAWWVGRL